VIARESQPLAAGRGKPVGSRGGKDALPRGEQPFREARQVLRQTVSRACLRRPAEHEAEERGGEASAH